MNPASLELPAAHSGGALAHLSTGNGFDGKGTMQHSIDAQSLSQFHDALLLQAEPAGLKIGAASDPWRWIEENHRYNRLLWDEEDRPHRTDVGADAIAASKRLIDRYNQRRNDAVEAIDEALLALLPGHPRRADARLHSETAGARIDRLSILCLKIHHMRRQTLRRDAGADHIAACRAKLERLQAQRHDLGTCFDALLAEVRAGRSYFKLYRQFKMYNDPALNPYLYRAHGGGANGTNGINGTNGAGATA
jgi:hypothetical protein